MDSTNLTAAPEKPAPLVVRGASTAGIHRAREAVRAFAARLHPPPDPAVTDTLPWSCVNSSPTHCATAAVSTRFSSPPTSTH
jgi:hypothetical protein